MLVCSFVVLLMTRGRVSRHPAACRGIELLVFSEQHVLFESRRGKGGYSVLLLLFSPFRGMC